jgi:hypothetical protein
MGRASNAAENKNARETLLGQQDGEYFMTKKGIGDRLLL